MIGEIIQEYLVGLGVRIDKPGFSQADRTINQLGATIDKVTGGMAANFVKAGTIITAALAGVAASTIGLMKNAATTDMQMQKMATSMMISSDAAWRLKSATDALGESINDIALNPELLGRFRELVADGSRLQVGGDFKSTMQGFRDLIFQFTRLKQEVSYAMTWVGYYLMKYLQRPLAEIQEKFRAFNDAFVKNIAVWTDKVARGIVYIVNIGRHFIAFIFDVGKHIKNMWDEFPKGVKIATLALGAFLAVWKMTPLSKAITLISLLLSLIDDYYGYHEGKQAALGDVWDKLDIALEKAAVLYNEIAEGAGEVADAIGTIISEIAGSKEWRNFTAAMIKLKDAFFELGGALVSLVKTALQALFGEFSKKDIVNGFIEIIKAAAGAVTDIANAISGAYKKLSQFYKRLKNNKDFIDFWRKMGGAVKSFGGIVKNVVTGALKLIGRLGSVLIKLVNRDYTGAIKDIKDIMLGRDNSGKSKPQNGDPKHGGGGGEVDYEENARIVYERFKAAGYDDDAIAGIMGRVQQEHNFDTSDVEEHWAYDDEGNRLWVGGYGMFQWNGGRTDAFLNWAAENNLNPQEPAVQADYAILEAKERDLGPEQMNRMNVSEAATAWTDKWEVGVHGYEQEYAANWQNRIASGWGTPKSTQYAANEPSMDSFRQLQSALTARPDPVLMRGAPTGAASYASTSFMGGSNSYRIDLGGITVNGSNASPKEIGRAVGDEFMSRLQDRAWFLQKNAAATSQLV